MTSWRACAGYSRQAAGSQGRRQNLAATHQEDVGRCAFRQMALLVQQQRVVEALGVDAFQSAGVLHPGKHLCPRQFPVGEDSVGNEQELVRRRPRGQFARKDQQVGGGAAGCVSPQSALILDKGKPRRAFRPLIGGGQLHNRFPHRFLLVIERNTQAFRVVRHPLPMPVEGKRNSLVDAQGGEDAPTHQQAHLSGRKARFREGNNPVVMIDEGIHVGDLPLYCLPQASKSGCAFSITSSYSATGSES